MPSTVLSSYAGGLNITFKGFGFDENSYGAFLGRKMQVVESQFDSLTLMTPIYATELLDETYQLS